MTLIPMVAFLKMKRLVRSDKITFIDSTKISVCHNKRIPRNRVFKDIAKRGKSTIGWFYGFKLHIALNHYGLKVHSGLVDSIISKFLFEYWF